MSSTPNISQNTTNGAIDITGADGSTQLAAGDQPAALNWWRGIGGQSGVAATLLAEGSDTNVWGSFVAQGAGGFFFSNASGTLASIPDPGGYVFAYPVLEATMQTSNFTVSYSAGGNQANVAVALVPIGNSGASIGINNTTSSQGSYSAGRANTSSGYGAGTLGTTNVAAGYYSLSIGNEASDSQVNGKICFAHGRAGSVSGSNQGSFQTLFCSTVSGTTPATATSGGGAVNNQSIPGLVNNASQMLNITVVARDTATPGICAGWSIKALVNRGASAGGTTLVGSSGSGAPLFSVGAGASSWTVTLAADTTNGGLTISCTGAVGNTVRWQVVTGPNAELING